MGEWVGWLLAMFAGGTILAGASKAVPWLAKLLDGIEADRDVRPAFQKGLPYAKGHGAAAQTAAAVVTPNHSEGEKPLKAAEAAQRGLAEQAEEAVAEPQLAVQGNAYDVAEGTGDGGSEIDPGVTLSGQDSCYWTGIAGTSALATKRELWSQPLSG